MAIFDAERSQIPDNVTRPILVMNRKDDQTVPYADAGPLSANLLKKRSLKIFRVIGTA
jgi:hypothetical protein